MKKSVAILIGFSIAVIVVLAAIGTIIGQINAENDKLPLTTLYIQKYSDKNYEMIDGIMIYTNDQFLSSDFSWRRLDLTFDVKGIECLRETVAVRECKNAVILAKSIIAEYRDREAFLGFDLYSIIHLSKDDTWLFQYRPLDAIDSDGGEMTIAINGSNCKVIKAWISE